MAIHRVLQSPVYAGKQYVEPNKDYPGSLFPAQHEAMIDYVIWQNIQQKFKGLEKAKAVVTDEILLRGGEMLLW